MTIASDHISHYNPFLSSMVHDNPSEVLSLIDLGYSPIQAVNFITPTYICKYSNSDFNKFIEALKNKSISFSTFGYMEQTELYSACNETQLTSLQEELDLNLDKAQTPGCMQYCPFYMDIE